MFRYTARPIRDPQTDNITGWENIRSVTEREPLPMGSRPLYGLDKWEYAKAVQAAGLWRIVEDTTKKAAELGKRNDRAARKIALRDDLADIASATTVAKLRLIMGRVLEELND